MTKHSVDIVDGWAVIVCTEQEAHLIRTFFGSHALTGPRTAYKDDGFFGALVKQFRTRLPIEPGLGSEFNWVLKKDEETHHD